MAGAGAAHPDDRHGREATRPQEIPWPGWRDILSRLRLEIGRDRVGLVSAGLAFYALMAFVPALVALVSVYGLIADPAQVDQQMQTLARIVPQDAFAVISAQLQDIVSASGTGLGWSLVISLLFAIWSASTGIQALITGVNLAYNESERRNFIKLRGLALLFTLGLLLFLVVAIGLIAVLPAVLQGLGLGTASTVLINALRWILLAAAGIFGLAVVYRYAPCRENARWQWVTWGSATATLLWLGASMLFSYYVSSFGNFNETYGALGGVVVLLLWFFISSFAILLGAELNSEIEHQTRRDSTTGAERPMGERGAFVADTLGDERGGRASDDRSDGDEGEDEADGQRLREG